jgi:hypothetical protein
MNLAFPALFAVLIVLPGILLRYTYLRGAWGANSPFVMSSITDEVAYGLFFAAALHLFWATLLSLFGLHIDFSSALMLLIGVFGANSSHFDSALAAATTHPYQIALYFMGLFTLSLAVGYGGHSLVRHSRLDIRYPILRFRNDWHYLMSGEISQFPQHGGNVRPVDGVYLSAVVKQGNECYIYRVIVADYYFDRTGNLDWVLLREAQRRPLTADRRPGQARAVGSATAGEEYYDIVGDFFVIRYADMQTINIDMALICRSVPGVNERNGCSLTHFLLSRPFSSIGIWNHLCRCSCQQLR